jgi:hypothetical protein
MLEAWGLPKHMGGLMCPSPDDGLATLLFGGYAPEMSIAFSAGYENAEALSRLCARRFSAAGFLMTTPLRRIKSALQRQRIAKSVFEKGIPARREA